MQDAFCFMPPGSFQFGKGNTAHAINNLADLILGGESVHVGVNIANKSDPLRLTYSRQPVPGS